MIRVLIVEDDSTINNLIFEYLTEKGCLCRQAFSGTEGRLLFSMEEFDLALIDLMIPGLTGEELIAWIRERSQAPVIVLSAKTALEDKVELLAAGADDYLTKPFELAELWARIQVQLRHRQLALARASQNALDAKAASSGAAPSGTSKTAHGPSDFSSGISSSWKTPSGASKTAHGPSDFSASLPDLPPLVFRDWTLDSAGRTFTVKGRPIELTAHEFGIVELFMRYPKKVFTKQDIFESVWQQDYFVEDKTINVHISNIRAKLKKTGTDQYIQTVWGIGFRLIL